MCTKQSILLSGGGDIDPICLPRGGSLAPFFFPWGGDIAIRLGRFLKKTENHQEKPEKPFFYL